MITFEIGQWRFTYRVGAIIVRDGHVMLMRMGSGDFWFVPGGRVEAGEPAKAALGREVAEELGVEGQVGRLLWTSENFFKLNETLYHEIALYFLTTIPDDAHRELSGRFTGTEGETPYECAWYSLGSLGQIRLEPRFLVGKLNRLPDATEHVVHIDDSAAPILSGR
jgi:ADP-ribose pyrophosphatase YjhB (NUDIX family)